MDVQQKVLVIIGPSGAGKSSVIQLLAQKGLLAVNPSWTTRPPRPEESTGSLEHVFVSEAEFAAKENTGAFIKTGQLPGMPYMFGLPPLRPTTPSHISTLVLRAPLAKEFKAVFPNAIIYQITDSKARIEKRLLEREAQGEASEAIGARRSEYEREIALGKAASQRTFENSGTITSLANKIAAALQQDFS